MEILPARAALIHRTDRQTDEQVEVNGPFRKLYESARKPWALQENTLTPVRAVDACDRQWTLPEHNMERPTQSAGFRNAASFKVGIAQSVQ
jgi:hypothetical protein